MKFKSQKEKNKKQIPFAKKSFGQNFLIDQGYINKIISELNPQKDETIIEIGAGRGALTRKLVETAGKIIAVELDKDLVPILQAEFSESLNFTLIEDDALKVDFIELLKNGEPERKAKLVANLPYYISTAILQRLIEQRQSFSELILMLQREVVERITAPPGNSERGFLTVIIEAYAQSEKLFDVPPNAFRPAPKVWSSVIKIEFKSESFTDNSKELLFWQIVSAGFAQKRKTIFNNLKSLPPDLKKKFNEKENLNQILEEAGIYPSLRAEALTLEQWLRLVSVILREG